eukprot:1303169-Ditylum_brightwellii.AAC.1
MPQGKQHNASALVQYVLRLCRVLSHLTLAVVMGTLQSLVPTAPGNVGLPCLCHLYDVIHQPDTTALLPLHSVYYYRAVFLTEMAKDELSWWERYLTAGMCTINRALHLLTLATSWGDGNRTGSGSTLKLVSSSKPLSEVEELWMEVWTTAAIHPHSR